MRPAEPWPPPAPNPPATAPPPTADYHLTGLISCPDCGNAYIGTAATGRTRTYRYYTCYSRNRYGTAGCQGPRLDADQADTAVLHALCDFYTRTPHLITAAITRARAHHHQGHASHRAEHDAITAQIQAKQNAVERYYQAFENSTMTEAVTGQRTRKLEAEIAQLQARATEITDSLATTPEGPDSAAIAHLQDYLTEVTAAGTPAERKTAIEALIAEIRITEQGVIPVFKIPRPEHPPPAATPTARLRTRFAQQCIRWGVRGSNPEPTD